MWLPGFGDSFLVRSNGRLKWGQKEGHERPHRVFYYHEYLHKKTDFLANSVSYLKVPGLNVFKFGQKRLTFARSAI